MMRRRAMAGLVVAAVSAGGVAPVWGQTHKVQKAEAVVRAVGVYEWTGELEKPGASRLIPVTVFINGELEDGAIFQPRPIPFALLPGNEYALQQAGVERGIVELRSAAKTAGADEGNTDGWWGYGTFRPEREVKAARLRVLKDESKVVAKEEAPDDHKRDKGDPERPTLRRRSAPAGGKDAGAAAPANPTTSAGSLPPDDPDRPVLKKHAPAASGPEEDAGAAAPASASGAPAAASASGAPAAKGAAADGDDREVATGSLNRDANRPVLHRGKPTTVGVADTPDAAVGGKLMSGGTAASDGVATASGVATAGGKGGAKEMHQMVAVSDASNRPEHDFARAWTDDAERRAVVTEMEGLARARLAAYVVPAGAVAAPVSEAGSAAGSGGVPRAGVLVGQKAGEGAPVQPNGGPSFPAPKAGGSGSVKAGTGASGAGASGLATVGTGTSAAARRPVATTAAARRRAALAAARVKKAGPPVVGLEEEEVRGYLLSYGGAPTYVLTAHTAGVGAELRYVTVVAQQDVQGKLQMAFGSVTDAAHLDRVAAMRLVGVVDAEASNRASLLFELREQGGRQFALYRVLGARSEALFTTGVTP